MELWSGWGLLGTTTQMCVSEVSSFLEHGVEIFIHSRVNTALFINQSSKPYLSISRGLYPTMKTFNLGLTLSEVTR